MQSLGDLEAGFEGLEVALADGRSLYADMLPKEPFVKLAKNFAAIQAGKFLLGTVRQGKNLYQRVQAVHGILVRFTKVQKDSAAGNADGCACIPRRKVQRGRNVAYTKEETGIPLVVLDLVKPDLLVQSHMIIPHRVIGLYRSHLQTPPCGDISLGISANSQANKRQCYKNSFHDKYCFNPYKDTKYFQQAV